MTSNPLNRPKCPVSRYSPILKVSTRTNALPALGQASQRRASACVEKQGGRRKKRLFYESWPTYITLVSLTLAICLATILSLQVSRTILLASQELTADIVAGVLAAAVFWVLWELIFASR